MKVAIIGSGPLGLESALHLLSLEAEVVLFSDGNKGGSVARICELVHDLPLWDSWNQATSKLGRDFSGKSFLGNEKISNLDYLENYFLPIYEKLKELSVVREVVVDRVTKTVLKKSETPKSSSRLADLFRVTFRMNTKDLVKMQKDANEQVFEGMNEQLLASLKRSIEMSEDFDVVIDARGSNHVNPIGSANSYCLNEKYFNTKSNFLVGIPGIEQLEDIRSKAKNITICGEELLSSFWIYLLKDWIFEDSGRQLFIISENKDIANQLGQTGNDQVDTCVQAILEKNNIQIQKSAKSLENAIKKWEKLEDYERVKVPKPQEEKPKIEFYAGFSTISIDQMEGNNCFFLTMEPKRDLESHLTHEYFVKTLSTDYIVNANNVSLENSIFSHLQTNFDLDNLEASKDGFLHPEPGLYSLSNAKDISKIKPSELIETGIKKLPKVVDNLMNYFNKK